MDHPILILLGSRPRSAGPLDAVTVAQFNLSTSAPTLRSPQIRFQVWPVGRGHDGEKLIGGLA